MMLAVPDEADPAEVAAMLRAVLAEVADPASELTAHVAWRHRIEGAALALDALAALDKANGNDRLRSTPPTDPPPRSEA